MALTKTAIHDCVQVWKTGQFTVPQEFGSGGGAQRKCDTRHINHTGNTACTGVFCPLDADFPSSLPEVKPAKIDNICSMITRRIYSTGTDPAMAKPHHNHGCVEEDLLDYDL